MDRVRNDGQISELLEFTLKKQYTQRQVVSGKTILWKDCLYNDASGGKL